MSEESCENHPKEEKRVEVKYLENYGGAYISQIYSSGVQFSFLSDKNEQCHPLVFCKDFLQDAIMSQLNNQKINIYSFEFDPAKYPAICLGKLRMLIAQRKDPLFDERVSCMVDFINQVCQKLKLKKCSAKKASLPPKGYDHVYVLEGSGKWLNSPPMISMLSLFLRVGLAHKLGDDYQTTIDRVSSSQENGYGRQDYSQLSQAKKAIDGILQHGYRKFFYIDNKKNFPQIDTGTMHNSCGLVGLSNGYTKAVVPYWEKKMEKILKPEKK